MNIVYAFFTARAATIEGSATSGNIKIGFSSNTTINNTLISSASGNIDPLLPGDDITIEGEVENIGQSSIYALLNFTLTLTVSNTTQTLENSTYTIVNNEVVELDSTNNAAFLIGYDSVNEEGETVAFTLTHTLSTSYGNIYQGASLTFNITAYAIQTAHVASGAAAATLLTTTFSL